MNLRRKHDYHVGLAVQPTYGIATASSCNVCRHHATQQMYITCQDVSSMEYTCTFTWNQPHLRALWIYIERDVGRHSIT